MLCIWSRQQNLPDYWFETVPKQKVKVSSQKNSGFIPFTPFEEVPKSNEIILWVREISYFHSFVETVDQQLILAIQKFRWVNTLSSVGRFNS